MRALAAMLVVMPALAQAEVIEKGVRGGVAVMSVDAPSTGGTGSDALNIRPGFAAATWITWHVAGVFSLQTEAQVSVKRLFQEHCSPCETLEHISLWYLDLPVVMRFDALPGEGSGKIHFDLGVAPVITLGGTQKELTTQMTKSLDLIPGNVAVVAGVGGQFGAGPGRIALDARYERYLFPLSSGDLGEDRVKSSNQFLLTVGYAFP